jgi:hypothetical protein
VRDSSSHPPTHFFFFAKPPRVRAAAFLEADGGRARLRLVHPRAQQRQCALFVCIISHYQLVLFQPAEKARG